MQKIMNSQKASKDSRWKNLYNNEAGSDVTFLVGNPECWRFPAHIDVLSKYPVFEAMLREPWSKKGIPILIPDDDPRAFDNLLKHMYKNGVELKSVMNAMETIGLANKYMCVDLVDECIFYLSRNLTVDTVLMVYRMARLYGSQTSLRREHPPQTPLPEARATAPPLPEARATAPPLPEAWATAPPLQNLMPEIEDASLLQDLMPMSEDAHAKAFAHMVRHYDKLLAYCYAFIDRNADRVMTDESVEELDSSELRELLRRDSLAVSSEMVLFATLEQWCTHKCKQQHLELTTANRRAVLGDAALLSVRYLQMTAKEFQSGPKPSGLLTEQETAVIMTHILDPKRSQLKQLTDDTLEYMTVPRIRGPHRRAGGGLSYIIKWRRSSSSSSSKATVCAADDDEYGQLFDPESPRRSSDKNKPKKKKNVECIDNCFWRSLFMCINICFE